MPVIEFVNHIELAPWIRWRATGAQATGGGKGEVIVFC